MNSARRALGTGGRTRRPGALSAPSRLGSLGAFLALAVLAGCRLTPDFSVPDPAFDQDAPAGPEREYRATSLPQTPVDGLVRACREGIEEDLDLVLTREFREILAAPKSTGSLVTLRQKRFEAWTRIFARHLVVLPDILDNAVTERPEGARYKRVCELPLELIALDGSAPAAGNPAVRGRALCVFVDGEWRIDALTFAPPLSAGKDAGAVSALLAACRARDKYALLKTFLPPLRDALLEKPDIAELPEKLRSWPALLEVLFRGAQSAALGQEKVAPSGAGQNSFVAWLSLGAGAQGNARALGVRLGRDDSGVLRIADTGALAALAQAQAE